MCAVTILTGACMFTCTPRPQPLKLKHDLRKLLLSVSVPANSNSSDKKDSEPAPKPAVSTEKRKADSTEPAPDEPVKQKARTEMDLFQLTSFLADRKGEREEMQDAHLQLDDYSSMFSDIHPSM